MGGESKGIEIVRQPAAKAVSVISGGVTIDTQGQAVDLHLKREQGQVYFLIDCSVSMAGYKLEDAKQGILGFARDAIRKEYLLGLIEFASSATILCKPGQDITLLRECLKTMRASGGTNMAVAIKMANEALKDVKCDRAIVIATDGQPDKVGAALKAGQAAKDDGIDIITIGTDDADQEFLKKLASRADLGRKVPKEKFAQGIASASQLLPPPRTIIKP
ncbi:VWA domain-containing protein [Chloroflexota bacterium]